MVIHSPFTTWDYNNLDLYPGSAACTHRAGPFDARGGRAARREHRLRARHREHRGQGPGCPRPLARRSNSDAVRVSLDTGHAHYAHMSTGAPPVDYYVDAAGDDARPRPHSGYRRLSDRHWAPGEGSMRWGCRVPRARPAELKPAPDPSNSAITTTFVAGAAHLAALGLAVKSAASPCACSENDRSRYRVTAALISVPLLLSHERDDSRPSHPPFPSEPRRRAAGTLVLPRFSIGQADSRPSITIAVQKVTNSNTLDVLREQSNVGERVFFSSLVGGPDLARTGAATWRRCRASPPNGAASTTRPSS